jgi:hypothetical protein
MDRRVAWYAAAVGAVRVLPEAALGASLAGRFSLAKSLAIAVDLSLLPPIREGGSLGDFAWSGAWGAAGACYDVEFGVDVAVSTCLSGTLGALHVTVYDPTPVEPGARLFAGLVGGPELRFSPARPFDIVFGVSAFVPIKRSSFLVETGGGTEALFTQPVVGALFKLGAGFGQ